MLLFISYLIVGGIGGFIGYHIGFGNGSWYENQRNYTG